ncbi:hypothetical protein FOA52_003477 [Chlamydomonas sp. UWO 241]|nr:hypothetical protein FOA52_003477 [Chlamydomonas sp. UWO 241]
MVTSASPTMVMSASPTMGDLLGEAKQIELLFRLNNLLVGEGLLPEGSAPTELLLRLHNLLRGEG